MICSYCQGTGKTRRNQFGEDYSKKAQSIRCGFCHGTEEASKIRIKASLLKLYNELKPWEYGHVNEPEETKNLWAQVIRDVALLLKGVEK